MHYDLLVKIKMSDKECTYRLCPSPTLLLLNYVHNDT